jgi:general secretion pathway protein D
MLGNKVSPLVAFVALALVGCESTHHNPLKVQSSYLEQSSRKNLVNADSELNPQSENKRSAKFEYYPSLDASRTVDDQGISLEEKFSSTEMVSISTDDLSVKDFLHYVFGELLGASYILGGEANNDSQKLTLNLQTPISKRELFSLSGELLLQKGYVIRFNDGIYYIHQSEQGGKPSIAYGYGRLARNVPNTTQDIIQYVPYRYGEQITIIATINRLFNVQAMPASDRGALSLKGKRDEILKALDFIEMLDRPSLADKSIALYSPVYRSVSELSEELEKLLKEEGISFTAEGRAGAAVSGVLLERSGKMIVFANQKEALQRVEFWLNQLDKPSEGSEKKYHVYQPAYARATDLGASLQTLIGGRGATSTLNDSTSAAAQNESVTKSKTSITAANTDMRMVVDERSNSLIIESSGEKYRELLPLIKRLDVMPKQVMLEVIIAEVQLTGKFEQGVEFALTNRTSSRTNSDYLLGGSAGALNYILRGADGNLTLNFLETNTNVDILSRPSLVVRDGVSATMNAGDNVPTLGKILTDPTTGSQQSVEYRKTGIQLTVTPTINAQGVVIMEIDQTTSNTSDGSSAVAGAPIFTERTITTEAVAASGQTVVLGGLIRENKSKSDNSVPFFSDLPIIGSLFEGKGSSSNKVELIVMVTPRIIESSESWKDIKGQFLSRFQYLSLEN